MREAVIVSTARTPIGKAYRGAFNNTYGATLAGHSIAAVVERAGIDPAEIDDVVFGCALEQGTTGNNIARQAALRAAEDDVVDLGRVDARALDDGGDRVTGEGRAVVVVEGAAIGLADRGAGGGDDDGFTHWRVS